MPETELQRQQLLRLLLQQADDKQPSPADSHRTFKIDWPGVEERRNTTATLRKLPRAAGNTNESRYSAFYNGREHIVRPPPQMNSVPEETLLDSRTDSPGGVGRLELCALVAPNNTYQDSEIPGMVNIYLNPLPRFTPPHVPRLQTNGYPVEKPEIHDLNSQLFTEKNQYGMVDNIEDGRGQYGLAVGEKLPRSVSQSSEQSRESRRREIELGSRGTGEG